ncbi:hypothetical protein AURDEDRAFT_36620, partial [Auricularia subglabra TFB-10046 SS5]
LSLYAAYESHFIAAKSVRTYLSGIAHSLEPFYPHVRASRSADLVRNTVAGCIKMSSHHVTRKSLLSRHDLGRMFQKYGSSPSHDDLLFLAILFTGFNGLLRLGELVWPDSAAQQDFRKVITHASFAWDSAATPGEPHSRHYSFLLPGHKGNRFFDGDTVVVTERADSANAVPIMRAYETSRSQLADTKFHPALFVRANGSVPTRSWFIRYLKDNFPDDIRGHSIRSGGATDLALRGVPDNLIQ